MGGTSPRPSPSGRAGAPGDLGGHDPRLRHWGAGGAGVLPFPPPPQPATGPQPLRLEQEGAGRGAVTGAAPSRPRSRVQAAQGGRHVQEVRAEVVLRRGDRELRPLLVRRLQREREQVQLTGGLREGVRAR